MGTAHRYVWALVLAMLVSGCSWPGALDSNGIGIVPLRRLCALSDLVISCRVLSVDGGGEMTLEVLEVLLSNPTLESVSVGEHLRVEALGSRREFERHVGLAFLVPSASGGLSEAVLGYSVRSPTIYEGDQVALERAVRAWQPIQALAGAQRQAAEVAWTVDLLESSVTIWDAIVDLKQTSTLPYTHGYYGLGSDDELDFDLLGQMTDKQLDRVVGVLCAPQHSAINRGRLAQLMASVDDPRILACLLEQVRAMAEGGDIARRQFVREHDPDTLFWEAGRYMEAIVTRLETRDGHVDDRLQRLWRKFEALPYGNDAGLPLLRRFVSLLPPK